MDSLQQDIYSEYDEFTEDSFVDNEDSNTPAEEFTGPYTIAVDY
jgi:hypothetical protein